MTLAETMHAIDAQLTHVWVVRTFLKHSEEAEENDELPAIVRELYDYCLALGPSLKADDAETYLKLARKKFSKLDQTARHLGEILPEVSAHTNFQMAHASLTHAVAEIGRLLAGSAAA